MDFFNGSTFNFTGLDYDYDDIKVDLIPPLQPVQIVALVLYGAVVLLGVPGNLVVVWVTGFYMKRNVTSMWFLNLALADLLCCLSIPLLMVPLAHDNHWHFGPLACKLVKGLFYLVMYSSILQLALISLDRLLLVTKPVWCQNHRRPNKAIYVIAVVWLLAMIASVPHFVFSRELKFGEEKRECLMVYSPNNVWPISLSRFLLGFVLPLVIIVGCHVMVCRRAKSGITKNRSKRTIRVVLAVVFSFFLCWLPLHIVDLTILTIRPSSPHRPRLYLAHILVLCLAYFNSCLNPLLYVCLGQKFKESVSRSMCGILHFLSDEPTTRISDTKSTNNSNEMTKV